MDKPLPVIDGVGASTVLPPAGRWTTVGDFLVDRFPDVAPAIWRRRCGHGRVLDSRGRAVAFEAAFVAGSPLHYYRELEFEPEIPFEAEILHRDEHLLIADKPHFLPVMPAGRWLQQTLLVRLKRMTGLDDLVPLHRIDRGTAGLVAFSVDPASRGRYQSLFPRREVGKVYEALAPLAELPPVHRSRLVAAEPFFRVAEGTGAPNSETRISRIGTLDGASGEIGRYRLEPVTGRKHQLRVHLAALGAPIVNDDFYPVLASRPDDDFSRPLKLLARELRFVDPLTGALRLFRSRRQL